LHAHNNKARRKAICSLEQAQPWLWRVVALQRRLQVCKWTKPTVSLCSQQRMQRRRLLLSRKAQLLSPLLLVLLA
jgi:hypothetical protein